MGKQTHIQAVSSPSDDFVEKVKQVLENLYDFSYLQQHPLTHEIGRLTGAEGGTPAQILRREVLLAIAALSPGAAVAFHSPSARLHNLLNLRYVEAMSIPEAAQEMAISVRQAHRDLRRGEENVASILWARSQQLKRGSPANNRPLDPQQVSSIQSELSLIKLRFNSTDIVPLVRVAAQAVNHLAELHTVNLHIVYPDAPIYISTDPNVAQQVVITLLSHTIQQASGEAIQIHLGNQNDSILLKIDGRLRANHAITISPTIVNLIERLGWRLEVQQPEAQHLTINLLMTTSVPTLLLIDDNEGLTKLFDRYLTGFACKVISAHAGQEGLRLAQELHPQVIVLDVMIPEMNGWELLQRLRSDPETATIPVVVCSVFNDPDLAYSLGAAVFLSKPLEREQLLAALNTLGII
jgi:CheY-like chemotaxis protein